MKHQSQPNAHQGKIGTSRPSDQRPEAQSSLSCGDFDMRIARDGTWYYRGSPIGRTALVKLFSTVLRREADGGYWLVTPVERGRIQVDDAPFTAVEFAVEGSDRLQVLRFRTNLDEWVEAGAERPLRVSLSPDTGEPSPYILVRDRLEALILRSVFYQLVDIAVEHRVDGKNYLGLWSKESFFPLGETS
jgi:hypothetical protein